MSLFLLLFIPIARKATHVRPEWVKKPSERPKWGPPDMDGPKRPEPVKEGIEGTVAETLESIGWGPDFFGGKSL